MLLGLTSVLNACLQSWLLLPRWITPAKVCWAECKPKPFVTLREESCERLFNIMSTKGLVLIKAPPCTGKTSQLQLMNLWLSDQPSGQPLEVIHISFLLLDDQDDVVEFIERRAKPTSWNDIKAGAEIDRPSRSVELHHSGSVNLPAGTAAVSLSNSSVGRQDIKPCTAVMQ